MKPIGSVTTSLISPEQNDPAGTEATTTGAPAPMVRSPAGSKNAPALTDLPQSVTSLTKSLTSLSLKHSRDGRKNVTQRVHTLAVPLEQAKQHYSTLMALNSPGTASQVTELLKRLFAMYPATQKKEMSVAQDWLRLISSQPLGAIWLAYEHFIRSEREFAPSAGVFLAKTDEQAKRIRIRLASLKEAIDNEGASS